MGKPLPGFTKDPDTCQHDGGNIERGSCTSIRCMDCATEWYEDAVDLGAHAALKARLDEAVRLLALLETSGETFSGNTHYEAVLSPAEVEALSDFIAALAEREETHRT